MSLVEAVAFALVGHRLANAEEPGPPEPETLTGGRPAADQGSVDPRQLVQRLASLGIDASTVAGIRRERQAAARPWPFPLPAELAVASPAQFKAILDAVRAELGVDGLRPTVAATRTPSADDLRLLREVPPHHGRL